MRRSLIEKKIYKLIREGISEYHLIDNGDKILVGLSGGKDSLALVDFLSKIKHLFENLEYYALHVRVDGIDYKSDENYLRDFCMSRGFHFISKNISFEADRDLNRTPCFLCSWNRRKTLFETAQELGCHKLALGHHQDDILQTALMNLAFNGSFSTMPAYLQMRKMPITIIRPLCQVPESLLSDWAVFQSYQSLVKVCPFDKDSQRFKSKEMIKVLQNFNSEFKSNLWHALKKENKLVEK